MVSFERWNEKKIYAQRSTQFILFSEFIKWKPWLIVNKTFNMCNLGFPFITSSQLEESLASIKVDDVIWQLPPCGNLVFQALLIACHFYFNMKLPNSPWQWKKTWKFIYLSFGASAYRWYSSPFVKNPLATTSYMILLNGKGSCKI